MDEDVYLRALSAITRVSHEIDAERAENLAKRFARLEMLAALNKLHKTVAREPDPPVIATAVDVALEEPIDPETCVAISTASLALMNIPVVEESVYLASAVFIRALPLLLVVSRAPFSERVASILAEVAERFEVEKRVLAAIYATHRVAMCLGNPPPPPPHFGFVAMSRTRPEALRLLYSTAVEYGILARSRNSGESRLVGG